MDALGYAQLPDEYEPLAGYTRYRVIDRHPCDPFVAMEAIGQRSVPTVAVWDTRSGSVIYAPKDASLIGWVDSYVLVLRRANPSHSSFESAAEVDGCDFRFERRTWPSDEVMGACDVDLYSGWPHSLSISPHGNLAIIRTRDQDISGWDFVILSGSQPSQLVQAGFDIDSYAALSAEPAYSSDGRYAVSGYHTSFTKHATSSDLPVGLEIPLQHGIYEVGCLTVVDVDGGTSHHVIVDDAVPVALHRAAAERLDPPRFVDSEHFIVTFLTGEQRTYGVQQ